MPLAAGAVQSAEPIAVHGVPIAGPSETRLLQPAQFEGDPLLLMLPAGHVIDRSHRGRIVAICLGCQFVIALCLVMLTFADSMGRNWLLLISVALGALGFGRRRCRRYDCSPAPHQAHSRS